MSKVLNPVFVMSDVQGSIDTRQIPISAGGYQSRAPSAHGAERHGR